jgi:DNA modification methylase
MLFMFVLSKGTPKTFNSIFENCKYAGRILQTHTTNPESIRKKNVDKATKDKKIKSNVWDFVVAGTNYGHPAIFPEKLANDHIISWSNEGDLVYDPFMGSGTTAKMAILNNRKYIGSEISEEYCKIIETRIKECGGLFFNSFETELSNEAET